MDLFRFTPRVDDSARSSCRSCQQSSRMHFLFPGALAIKRGNEITGYGGGLVRPSHGARGPSGDFQGVALWLARGVNGARDAH